MTGRLREPKPAHRSETSRSPHSRASNMSDTVEADIGERPAAGPAADGVAPVFLLPGLFGDEPKLMHLRERLAGRVRFVTLKIPDIEAPESLLSSLPAIGRIVADEIVRRQPIGPISIAGYSFGASVALEAAAQLARADRTVGYLCILDGAFKVDDLRRSFRTIVSLAMTPKGALCIVRRIVEKINDRRYLRLARRSPDVLVTSQPVRRAYISYFRGLALDGWEPDRCLARGILILTRSLGPANRPKWLELCPNLTLLPFRSGHDDLLEGESLDLVVSALGEDFAAWTVQRGEP